MADRYNFHVTWSPNDRKYAARSVDVPAYESVATTPQQALDDTRQLVDDVDNTATQPLSLRVSEGTGRARHQPRVIPRWRTRC